MSVPVIDPESSVLSYPQWLTWEHQFSATNLPASWQIVAGGFPSGMTFEPSWSVTGTASGHTIGQPSTGLFANGTILVFSALTGGTGLSTATRYYVVNSAGSTFQLAATSGGAAIAFSSDITAATLFRPGYLAGAASLPGICTVQLTATNGDGASLAVLFTIGIEPAAAVPDSNLDLVWDFATNNIIAQTSATLNLTPPTDPATPILYVKEQDDLIARLRLVKAGSVLDLGDPVSLKLVLKELEPENQIVISDDAVRIGSGDGTSYLIHAKFDGTLLAGALSNYEADGGTFFPALAEIELTFVNTYGCGPSPIVRTSKTFRIQIDRDLGEAA
jgi:hypothetical protein